MRGLRAVQVGQVKPQRPDLHPVSRLNRFIMEQDLTVVQDLEFAESDFQRRGFLRCFIRGGGRRHIWRGRC